MGRALVESNRSQAMLLLVLTAILWSMGGLFIKWVDWHPLAIAGVRSLIAGSVIWAFFRKTPLTWSRPQMLGAAAYAATVMLFVAATKLTTAANTIVLQYTAPIYVALFGAWFLKEKASRLDWITIAVVFGGMLLFFMDSMEPGDMLGNALAVGSGITLAFFAMAMRKQKDGAPHGSVLIGNGLTFLCGLPFMFGSLPDAAGWAALLVLGIFQLGISYVMYSIAIKQVTALEATLITIIEPILNPVWVYFLIGEAPGVWSLLGGVVIIAAILARGVVSACREPAAKHE